MTDDPAKERTCLVVSCHPLEDSLCRHLTDRVVERLERSALTVERLDLYQSGFAPALTGEERANYYVEGYDWPTIQREAAALRRADALVLIFPTWWFGYPAMLKGWFDRVWAPGVAFDNHPEGKAIIPRLTGLKRCLAITTLGSPKWVDRLVMRQPVRRNLKTALLKGCAPNARLRVLSLYAIETVSALRIERFKRKIDDVLDRHIVAR
ncbi:MAG: NAD(P)H-dependent oxidoreductase [Pseudomonadota bacterium]